MKNNVIKIFLFIGFFAFMACETQKQEPTAASTSSTEGIDRTVLPIKQPQLPTYNQLEAKDITPPARFEVKAPEGAPNVILVLVDDLSLTAMRQI